MKSVVPVNKYSITNVTNKPIAKPITNCICDLAEKLFEG